MPAAQIQSTGRRRLLTLIVVVLATAATLSFGLVRATASTLQTTSTSISITDANTGAPITGSIPSTELVTLTATVTGTTSAPTGTIGFQTTTDGVNYTPMCDSGGNCSWNVSPAGGLTSQGSVTMWLPAGTYDIQAGFRGTNGSLNSTSPKPGTPVTVTQTTVHNTTTTVTANPNAITSGQASTLTATVTSDDGSGIPQGTVYFYADSGNVKTFIAQGTLDANGQTSFTSSSWATQTYTIEADYLGVIFTDQHGATVQYGGSGGTTTLTVTPAVNPQVTTTTTVVATPSIIRSDQSINLVATVAENGHSTLQGATLNSSVIFSAVSISGYAVIGSAPLVDNGDGTGTAVLNQAGWVPGSYTITAQYFGNIYFQSSSGTTNTIVVNQAEPSTTTYLHDTQTYVGDTATLSAKVLGPNSVPVPAGEVVPLTANDSAGTGCLGTTDSNGIASCTVQFPAPGTYSVTASYPGDSTFDPSTGFGQITVLQVPTNVAVTASPNPAPTGSSDTLTGHLTDARNGSPVTGKTLTLKLNNNETCTAGPTDASGNASCTVTVSEGPGSYQTSVSFAGDGASGRYLPSSGSGTLTVVNVLPTTWTYTGTTSVYAGQPATISFVLKDNLGRVMANRSVTLGLNGTSYSVTTNASGVATQAVTAPTTPGSYTPTASYAGEAGYLSSTGNGSLQVNTIPTSLTYVGDTNVNGGSTATLKFVLKDQGGNTLANMPVTLTFQGMSYNVTTDASGVASTTASAPINAGSYSVTASFGGRLPYVASNGSGSVTVTTIPTTVTYVGDTTVVQGSTATLAAKLLDSGGNPLASEPVTLTLATGETCSGKTNASGVASCQTVVNEATTLPGSPYGIAISFGGDLPYLASTGNGALAVTAPYAAPADGFCSTHKCESMIANPTVVSSTQLQVLYTDDSVLPTTASLAPTAVLDGGRQLVVNVTPTSGQSPSYVDTYGGSTATKNQDFVNIAVPAGLTPGNHTIRVFISDGDGDWDQWTWTIAVGSNGSIGTVNPSPGPTTCGGSVKCESLLADPAVVSNSQLSIVAMDDSQIVAAGTNAPSATLNGQGLAVSTSATSGQPQNYVDKIGGSLATTYQILITINLPANLAPGTYSILVTAYDGDGDLDQWSWPITVAANGTVTSNFTGGGLTGKSMTSSITGTLSNAVTSGNTLWLTDSTKVTNLPAKGATITFTNQTVTSDGVTVTLPDAEVFYSPYATTATTAWDPVNNEWDTTVPKSLGGNIFASGLSYVAPLAIAKGTKVTWSATITSDTPGVTVAWQWASAAYTSFNSDPSQLGIKPCDDNKASAYLNGDKAGTPENYKSFVTAGGMGGGGPNYTGTSTASTSIKF